MMYSLTGDLDELKKSCSPERALCEKAMGITNRTAQYGCAKRVLGAVPVLACKRRPSASRHGMVCNAFWLDPSCPKEPLCRYPRRNCSPVLRSRHFTMGVQGDCLQDTG